MEFILAVESACQRLSEQDAQELRAEINHSLKRAKTPRSNITKEEKKALKELREDQDRMVLTADMRVAMVAMNKKGIHGQSGRLIGTTGLQDHLFRPTNQAKGQVNTEVKKNQKGNKHGRRYV